MGLFSYKYIERGTFNEYVKYRVYNTSKKNKKRKIGEKDRSNLRRARRSLRELIELNIEAGHLLVTLTYSENMQDYDRAEEDFKRFINEIGRPKYLAVKELQQRGAIHYHVLIFSMRVKELDIINSWYHGFVNIDVITDLNVDAISNYLGKYFTSWLKGQFIALNKKMFSCSRDLKRYVKKTIDSKDFYKQTKEKHYIITTDNYVKIIKNR